MPVHPASIPTMVKRKSKAVSFASSPSQVLQLPETEETELRSKWYSRQEYAGFKAAIINSVNAVGPTTAGGESVCSRGIEFMTKAGLAYRKQTKLKVLAAVWNCQVRQWNEQNRIYDPVSIALACQQETLQCTYMACTLGQLDQQAAIEEYQRTMLFPSQTNQTNQANSYNVGVLLNQSNSCIGGTYRRSLLNNHGSSYKPATTVAENFKSALQSLLLPWLESAHSSFRSTDHHMGCGLRPSD